MKNLLNKSSWTHLHKRKKLLNTSSKGKISWTNFQRKNLLNKYSWTNLHKRKNLLHIFKRKYLINKSSKDKSPKKSSQDKSLEQIFKNNSKSQIFNSKMFIPKFSIPHSQCPSFKLKSSVFERIQTSDFMIKIPSIIFKFQRLKISYFKFQISIKNF